MKVLPVATNHVVVELGDGAELEIYDGFPAYTLMIQISARHYIKREARLCLRASVDAPDTVKIYIEKEE